MFIIIWSGGYPNKYIIFMACPKPKKKKIFIRICPYMFSREGGQVGLGGYLPTRRPYHKACIEFILR